MFCYFVRFELLVFCFLFMIGWVFDWLFGYCGWFCDADLVVVGFDNSSLVYFMLFDLLLI